MALKPLAFPRSPPGAPAADGAPPASPGPVGGAGLPPGVADVSGGARGHAAVAPVYQGYVRAVDYGMTAASGRTAKFQLLDPADPMLHPFKGLDWARGRAGRTAAGQRLHIVLSQPDAQADGGLLTLYVGEGKLNWWSDDCKNGMRVVLGLYPGPEGADWHPLGGVEADARNGEALYLACWAVADDEAVQDPARARRAPVPFASLPAVRQSGLKCRGDESFRRWCAEEAAGMLDPERAAALPDFAEDPVRFAERVVREFCGVESRSVFGHDTEAGFAGRQRWHKMMRLYDDWRGDPANAAYFRGDPGPRAV